MTGILLCLATALGWGESQGLRPLPLAPQHDVMVSTVDKLLCSRLLARLVIGLCAGSLVSGCLDCVDGRWSSPVSEAKHGSHF